MVKPQTKVKTKTVNANFFHITYPSFRCIDRLFALLDGGSGGFIQIGISKCWNTKMVGLKRDEYFQSKIGMDSVNDNTIAGPRAPN